VYIISAFFYYYFPNRPSPGDTLNLNYSATCQRSQLLPPFFGLGALSDRVLTRSPDITIGLSDIGRRSGLMTDSNVGKQIGLCNEGQLEIFT